MFGWFRKYVRKVGIFGVEVEFHPPTEVAANPTVLPKSAELPATPAPVTALPAGSQLARSRPSGTVDGDKAAFLEQVKDKTNGEAQKVDDYERVLDDLIAWSEAQGGLLTFNPKPAANSQAKIEYRFRGDLFWDAWPQKRKPTKFTYEYDFERTYLLAEFAKLSANGQPASEVLPTVWFRDLVPEAARQRLKQLLGEVLGRLAGPPTTLR